MKQTWIFIAAMLMTATPALAQEDNKFDLICSALNDQNFASRTDRHYHIDLSAMTACDEDQHTCPSNPYKIKIEGNEIWIQDDLSFQGLSPFVQQKHVDRISGRYAEYLFEDGQKVRVSGLCLKRPFGFQPSRQF